jgi:alpha-mannosidase
VGDAKLVNGTLVSSFDAYQPRTFALKLGAPPVKIASVRSAAVPLKYDLATATNDGEKSTSGFDGKGNALPAEMLPREITFNDVRFQLAPAKTAVPNAVAARGQTLALPAGAWNRVYLLAASAGGDQKATFEVGNKKVELDIEDWSGFIGQWDDRQWLAKDIAVPAQPGSPAHTEHDDYAEMTGIKPGYIKRADLAWYCSHHHDAAGQNVPYSYSYLFAYAVDLPPGAKTIRLPDNDKIRVLAVSVAEENSKARPVQPLYDALPPAATAVARD